MNLQENIRRVLREETSQKRKNLLNIIKKMGLYDFTKDTGLTYNDIGFKLDELPREIKIQYLKDAVSDLEQLPYELDLTFITGSIPLFTNENDDTVYAEYISNRNDKLKLHTFIVSEEGYNDEYNVISEDDLDSETLETLVSEISEKLQYKRN